MFPMLPGPEKWANDIWQKIVVFMHAWGDFAAVIVSLYTLFRLGMTLLTYFVSCASFAGTYGQCAKQMLWAPCPTLFLLRKYRSARKQENEDEGHAKYPFYKRRGYVGESTKRRGILKQSVTLRPSFSDSCYENEKEAEGGLGLARGGREHHASAPMVSFGQPPGSTASSRPRHAHHRRQDSDGYLAINTSEVPPPHYPNLGDLPDLPPQPTQK